MKNLSSSWEDLTSTFWFIPVLIITIAIALAFILLNIDSKVFIAKGLLENISVNSTDSARSILSTIAATMIGVAGTVFSIILVVLTLTSSQFGSRLIKNFMYDRINQIVLGAYVSTFIYCLIIINAIKEGTNPFIPTISILFAIILAIINIILLIIFIHHISMSIQAETVIANISKLLTKNLETFFPETKKNKTQKTAKETEEKKRFKIKQNLIAQKSGYIQYINIDALIQLTKKLNIIIETNYSPGDYIIKNTKIATIYTNTILNDKKINLIHNCLTIKSNKSIQQDAKHSINQMVEIASRALSPGINDPYTAISCIDNLTAIICNLTNIKFPNKFMTDQENRLRLIVRPANYDEILETAFNQIREFSKNNPIITIKLMDSLIKINDFDENSTHKDIIKKHTKMLLRSAQINFKEPTDLKKIKEKSKLILQKNKKV